MAQLAIKGHPERGKEVIEILEMLGGKNIYEAKGDCINLLYILCDDKYYACLCAEELCEMLNNS